MRSPSKTTHSGPVKEGMSQADALGHQAGLAHGLADPCGPVCPVSSNPLMRSLSMTDAPLALCGEKYKKCIYCMYG